MRSAGQATVEAAVEACLEGPFGKLNAGAREGERDGEGTRQRGAMAETGEMLCVEGPLREQAG